VCGERERERESERERFNARERERDSKAGVSLHAYKLFVDFLSQSSSHTAGFHILKQDSTSNITTKTKPGKNHNNKKYKKKASDCVYSSVPFTVQDI
jgi:hypothetical protein